MHVSCIILDEVFAPGSYPTTRTRDRQPVDTQGNIVHDVAAQHHGGSSSTRKGISLASIIVFRETSADQELEINPNRGC